MAASILASGIPVYTQCQLQNHTGDDLYVTLDSTKFWHGHGDPPKAIQDHEDGNFKHSADSAGSIAAVAYVLGESHKLKWIIAWSNAEEQPNKVFTEILDGKADVNWDQVKSKLDFSGTECKDLNKGYLSEVTIDDENSSTPKLKAKLRPAA